MKTMLRLIDFQGNSYIGVFAVTSERFGVIPPSSSEDLRETIASVLDIELIPTMISNSSIIGTLACMNNHGMIVTNYLEDEERKRLEAHLDVTMIEDKYNAVGNNILANDNGAMVHPEMSASAMKQIEDTLDVEVVRGTIGSVPTVGAAAVATNKGVLCHPKINPEERGLVEDVFGAPVAIGTANYGVPLIGACVLANTHGALVGRASTGIELGRIEDALDLI